MLTKKHVPIIDYLHSSPLAARPKGDGNNNPAFIATGLWAARRWLQPGFGQNWLDNCQLELAPFSGSGKKLPPLNSSSQMHPYTSIRRCVCHFVHLKCFHKIRLFLDCNLNWIVFSKNPFCKTIRMHRRTPGYLSTSLINFNQYKTKFWKHEKLN